MPDLAPISCGNCGEECDKLDRYCYNCGKPLSLPKTISELEDRENEASLLMGIFGHDHNEQKKLGCKYCPQCGKKL